MKYKVGDIVKVTKRGIHFEEEAEVTEVNSMYMPKNFYYTVKLKNKQTKIIINENDLTPYKLISTCECGGDKLSIPHHYDWCPASKK